MESSDHKNSFGIYKPNHSEGRKMWVSLLLDHFWYLDWKAWVFPAATTENVSLGGTFIANTRASKPSHVLV